MDKRAASVAFGQQIANDPQLLAFLRQASLRTTADVGHDWRVISVAGGVIASGCSLASDDHDEALGCWAFYTRIAAVN